MDECKDQTRKELLQSLGSIQSRLKILVTSRLLEGWKGLAEGFQKETIRAEDADIQDYIDSCLMTAAILQDHAERIKQEVCKKSKGL